MITAAADLVGIPFPKLKRFAYVLNMKLFGEDTFYRLRRMFSYFQILVGLLFVFYFVACRTKLVFLYI